MRLQIPYRVGISEHHASDHTYRNKQVYHTCDIGTFVKRFYARLYRYVDIDAA